MDRKSKLESMLMFAEIVKQHFKDVKNYHDFEKNLEKIEAISFNFIQLGEYAKRLDSKFIKDNPELKIEKIVGLRNLFTNDYQGVSFESSMILHDMIYQS